MEVMLKREVVAKEEAGEAEVKCAGGEERREIGKFGSEISIRDRDPSRSSSPNQRDSSNNEQVSAAIRSETSFMDASSSPSSSSRHKNSVTNSQENQLDSVKAEMVGVREENERLKEFLVQMVKDYQSLQMHFFDMVQKEHVKKPVKISGTLEDVEEPEFVSLSLGTSASRDRKEEEEPNTYYKSKEYERINEGFTLGLQYKVDGSRSSLNKNFRPDNSFEEAREKDAWEPRPPNKAILLSSGNGEDEVLPQPPVKRARVSVRARCDAPTMHDGCQWRKYGQKIAKGNPCPRAYYRCTVGPACPVKKQVQRCAEDMSILTTTYEGIHNHPLPLSATAMASTTSAAATMLMSGSSTSGPAFGSLASSSSSSSTTTTSVNLHGFSLSDNSRLKQFYPPVNPSMYYSSNLPTITLDLTAPSTSTHVLSSTSLNFSSSKSNTMPTSSWGNGYSSYGAQSYSKSHAGSLNAGGQSQGHLPYYLREAASPTTPGGQQLRTDAIATAITSDPGFQSALAAAITSYVGSQRAQRVGEDYWSHQQGRLTSLQPPPGLESSRSA